VSSERHILPTQQRIRRTKPTCGLISNTHASENEIHYCAFRQYACTHINSMDRRRLDHHPIRQGPITIGL